MKKSFVLLVIFLHTSLLFGCFSQKISLIGGNEIDIEVYSDYYELGINMPEGYTFISNEIDTTQLGVTYINYRVIDSDGKEVTTLTRIINVIDSTPPIYELKADLTFTLGIDKLNIYELFEDVSDNYDDSWDLKFSSNLDEILDLVESGEYIVDVEILDSSDNLTHIQVPIYLEVNLQKLYEHLDKNTSISAIYNEVGDKTYYRIRIDYYHEIIAHLDGKTNYSYSFSKDEFNSIFLVFQTEFGNVESSSIVISFRSIISNNSFSGTINFVDLKQISDETLFDFSSYEINGDRDYDYYLEIFNNTVYDHLQVMIYFVENELNIPFT